MKDLKGLKRVADGDYKALHRMIETVENCWLDLKRMNLESEMDTTSMLSTVEKLLPEVQKREWTLQKPLASHEDGSSRFSKLLAFLIREKTAIEYMSDDLRNERKGKVSFAEVEEHEEEEELNKKEETSKETNLVINLFERQMESQRQLMELMANAFTTKPGSSGAAQNSFVTNSCWIHKVNGHNINECINFLAMTGAEKVDAVRKNRACFYCLQVGHQARQCFNKKQCGEVTGETLVRVPIISSSMQLTLKVLYFMVEYS